MFSLQTINRILSALPTKTRLEAIRAQLGFMHGEEDPDQLLLKEAGAEKGEITVGQLIARDSEQVYDKIIQIIEQYQTKRQDLGKYLSTKNDKIVEAQTKMAEASRTAETAFKSLSECGL